MQRAGQHDEDRIDTYFILFFIFQRMKIQSYKVADLSKLAKHTFKDFPSTKEKKEGICQEMREQKMFLCVKRK